MTRTSLPVGRLDKSRSQSLARGLAILDLFTRETPSYGVSDLARALKLNKSIVYRLVRTFVDHGLLEQDPATSRYRIGARAFEIGQLFVTTNDLQHAALPGLRALASEHKLNAAMGVLRGRDVIYLNALQSESVIVLRARPGSRGPAHATAMGKVLLSALDAARLDDVLERAPWPRYTPQTIVDAGALRSELQDVRRLGHAVAIGEYIPGIIAVGAPIRDGTGEVVAAVSGAGLKASIPAGEILRLVRVVTKIANQISRRLGATIEAEAPGERGATAGRSQRSAASVRRARARPEGAVQFTTRSPRPVSRRPGVDGVRSVSRRDAARSSAGRGRQ